MEAMVQGVLNVFSPVIFLYIFIGVVLGVIVGILPGIGGVATIAILLPFVYGKPPAIALAFLLSIYATNGTGGPITSILFGIPGETGNAPAILDGHPMAKQGRAGQALGAAITASMVGGILGAVWIAMLIPVVRPIIRAFGSPEIFVMALLGISFVAVLGRGSLPKAIVAGCLGLLLTFIGFHRGTGILRFTTGYIFLYDGLQIVPVMMGIFALPEVIDMMMEGTAIAKVEQSSVDRSQVLQGIKDVFRHWWLVLRCSAIGTSLGFVPGIGVSVATWLCYAHGKQTCKRGNEFGTGVVEGVIAPECADNAKEGGSLLTALAFGIPSGSGMAVLLAAIIMVGVVPGQEMMTKNLDLVWTLIITMIWANVLGALMCLVTARDLARVTFLKQSILASLILLFIILGAYGIANDFRDVIVSFIVGGIGYLMKRFDYSRVTFVIGFVLGDYIERYFLLSVGSLGPGFLLGSPIACALLAVTILGLASGGIKTLYRRLLVKTREEG